MNVSFNNNYYVSEIEQRLSVDLVWHVAFVFASMGSIVILEEKDLAYFLSLSNSDL